MIKKQTQTSDSLIIGLLLAFSGGFQDSYTYLERNQVFSNAQTGNVVFMGQSILTGDWHTAIMYLFPLLAFSAGVCIAEAIEHRNKFNSGLHWRRLVILIEIVCLFFVGFISHRYDSAASMLVSFACALQLQAFRKVGVNNYASTMCIGNLRLGSNAMSQFFRTHDKQFLCKAMCYFSIIFVFGIGAGICALTTPVLGERSIFGSCIILLAAYFVMKSEKIKSSDHHK